MQPKAAKKIGGMTPKKMTGGDYGEPEKVTIDGVYRVTKKIDEAGKTMMICVETDMPGAEAPVISKETLKEVVEEKKQKLDADGNPVVDEDGNPVYEELTGGKKKRKSSKKRKSMKKKGGMKRKSMKVKA